MKYKGKKNLYIRDNSVELQIKFTALVSIIFYGLIHYPEQQQKSRTELDMTKQFSSWTLA